MDKIMLNEYIEKAMQHARCEQIEDGTGFGRIPGFKGVWANQPTQQECREELREVLEGWILLNIADHTPLPTVDLSGCPAAGFPYDIPERLCN
jgi:predicted RNase H-like HicB family nuclease